MQIIVKAKTGSKENKVIAPQPKLLGIGSESEFYTVLVKERPIHGKANNAIIKLLSNYFSVPQSRVELRRGATSKMKIFLIKGLK